MRQNAACQVFQVLWPCCLQKVKVYQSVVWLTPSKGAWIRPCTRNAMLCEQQLKASTYMHVCVCCSCADRLCCQPICWLASQQGDSRSSPAVCCVQHGCRCRPLPCPLHRLQHRCMSDASIIASSTHAHLMLCKQTSPQEPDAIHLVGLELAGQVSRHHHLQAGAQDAGKWQVDPRRAGRASSHHNL